ncbi:TonB-linked outer membrane protein, SusC/RagA family [Flavobacterium fluvii]|uniref:TonB-linked outer membrane protein, SusC/RagA family n=1 Tax=Flavobacterium fluvii TaxID=468056 RepID=A0A1M5ITE2_9FLAO|nr:TonB-dependent receptor [Flavobacterium fluvii]SHG31526.1 TonB-linked outer membrane protein, SusC/RagA family [Flavobacterium fluvii]
MKKILNNLLWLGIFLVSVGINAQKTQPLIQSKLDGTVIDQITNEPIIGASINIKGTTHSVTSDLDGKFYFQTGQKFPYTLIISYIGYKKKEIIVDGSPVLVKLSADVQELTDVLIVGYGTQSRKSVVGSISKIKAEDVKQIPVASFDAQLQGRAPGLQVNTFSGTPGESVKVQVRGTASINASNDPLYVIDGMMVNNNSLATIDLGSKKTSPLADINPADIESIEVLKDASAIAIYGSRGANGIILVTTKRGSYKAEKPKYSFQIAGGLQYADTKKLWDLTTGPEHATLVNEQWINSGIDRPSLNQTYANRPFRPVNEVVNGVAGRGNPEDQQTYDRMERVFRTAELKNYNFDVQGGSDKIRYNIGVGYTDQEGILKPSSFERASGKLNLDIKLSDYVTFSSSNGVYRSFRQQVRGGAGQQAGHLLAALHHPTYLPLTNADGTPARGSIYENIDNLINTNITNISTKSIRYIGNHFLEFAILPNLKFKTSLGVDYNIYDESEFFNDQTIIGGSPNPPGYKKEVNTDYSVFQNENILSYTQVINPKNTITALLGGSFQGTNVDVLSATGQGFPNNSFQQISAASVRTSEQLKSKSTIASFFARVNYSYDDKYFLEGVIRADGSSKFGTNNRWGYFPAIGASWRIKQESFLQNVKSITELKLRLSAGSAGNQNGVNDYASQGLWLGTASYPDNLTSGPKPGTAPFQLENPDLRWEKTTTYNAGIDLGLFDNRVFINLDAYYKYTTDALLYVPIPSSTGYGSSLANAGEVSNKGIEFNLTTTNIKNKDFEWTTNFNISSNINRAEKLISPITFEAREYRRTEVGEPLGSFWLYKQLYVDPQTGDAVFDDVDKDGKLTQADRQLLGNTAPDYFGGFSNNFTYKGFDLNFLFTYQYGNDLFNFNKYILEGGGTRDASRSILASQLDRWQKPGDITNTPRVTSVGNNYNIEQNSRYLEDASFVRLKSFVLGYTLPSDVTRKINLSKVRVFALGTNLLLLTKYSGADPESSGSASQNLDGLDTATPPQPITIQLGVNVSF